MTVNQISVFLENRPGKLSELIDMFAAAGVDLRAINIAETADYGVVRLIAADYDLARDVLKRNGVLFTTTPVVSVPVPDRPGGLGEVLRLMAAGDVNIEYMYSMLGTDGGPAFMLFRVSDPARTDALLRTVGYDTGDA